MIDITNIQAILKAIQKKMKYSEKKCGLDGKDKVKFIDNRETEE